MLNDESCVRFCMTRAARALEIACDSRTQKLYRLNRPYLDFFMTKLRISEVITKTFRTDSHRNKLLGAPVLSHTCFSIEAC